jgi:ATP-dependent Zn protease
MFNDAFDTITFGVKKRIDTRDSETIQRLAIHEIGHAFMVNHFSEFFDLQRISIQPSYSGVGGFVIFNEKGNVVYTKDLFMKRLMIGLAGKAAEAIYYGDNFVSYGASMDLKQANELASEMIEKYGMGELLKVFSKSDVYGKTYSPNTYKNIDDEVLNLVNTAYDSVIHIMQENKHTYKNAISILSENLTMTGQEFVDLISSSVDFADRTTGDSCGCGV